MEKGLLREYESRFSQSAVNTPFLKSPLIDMVGLLGNTEISKSILEGKFQHNHLLPIELQDIIAALKQKIDTTTKRDMMKLFSRNQYRLG